MTTQVGGLNIKMGADTRQLLQGVKLVESRLRNFRNRMKTIRLAGSIKGDPFSETKNYMKTARKELDSVFKEWAIHVDVVSNKMSRFGQKSKQVTDDVIKSYEKASKKMNLLLSASQGQFRTGKGGLFGKISSKDLGKEDIRNKLLAQLETIKGVSGPITKAVNSLMHGLSRGMIKGKENLDRRLQLIAELIKAKGSTISKEYRAIGEKLKGGFTKQARLEYAEDLRQAKSSELALNKRREAVKKLTIEETRLRTEESKGINVEAARARIGEILNQKQKLGIKLNKKQTIELKKYNLAVAQSAKATARAGFFTRAWFQDRVRWFIELRLLWGMYRKVGDAVRSMMDSQVQLSRAMRTARSEISSTAEVTKEYIQAMRMAIGAHGVGWEKAGEVLYQLGSAGLSAEESLAGLNSTLSLIVGTEGDAREVTKSVAGIYNNFKDTIEGVTTAEGKLAHINDLIAAAWKRHQVEVSELVDGYKHVSAMGKVAGISLTDLTALISVANDHMIKGGRAGRAFSNMLGRISRMPRTFGEVFDIKIDTNAPLKFMDIMGKIAKKFKDTSMSVNELGVMFERFGLRAAPMFATMIQNWDEVIKAQEEYGDVVGEAANLEKIRLDNLDGQWKRMVGSLSAYVSRAEGMLDTLSVAISYYGDILQTFQKTQYGLDLLDKLTYGGDIAARYTTNRSLTNFDGEEKVVYKINEKEMEKLTKAQVNALGTLRKNLMKQMAPTDVGEVSVDTFDKDNLELIKRIDQVLASVKIKTSGIKEDVKEEKSVRELTESQAEREFYWLYKGDKSREGRLKHLKTQLGIQKKIVDKVEEDARKVEDSGINKAKTFAYAMEMLKKQKMIEKEIGSIKREQEQERKKAVSTEMTKLNYTIKGLGFERAKLRLKGTTRKEEERVLEINEEIKEKKSELSKLGAKDAKASVIFAAEMEKMTADEKTRNDVINSVLKERAVIKQTEINAKEEEIFQAEILHASDLKILELKKDVHEINLEDLEGRRGLVTAAIDQLRIDQQIREEKRAILDFDEKILRKSSKWYDFYQRLLESRKEFHDLVVESGLQFTQGTAKAVGTVVTNVTGGFQEQKQEIINLRHELSGLAKDYDEALVEGRVEEANAINQEMERLKANIEELEDPVHNVKEAFREMFKSLIDSIRQAINEWIAMQIVMGMVKAVGAGAGAGVVGGSSANVTAAGSNVDFSGVGMSTGGVTSSIKSFQSFSRGGMTGRPTLAVLGDNQSGKEIVIPEENIASDQVSGHVRDSEDQGIYIVNVIAPEDVAAAMAGGAGKRVVLNHVGKDMLNRGRTTRSI